MRIAKYKHLMVLLLMLTFIGQVVASASVSCQSSSSPLPADEQMMGSAMLDSGMMDHSQHMGSEATPLVGAVTSDCCPDCDCSLSGCSSVALPVQQSAFSSSPQSIASHFNESADSQLAVSLFRPPIAR